MIDALFLIGIILTLVFIGMVEDIRERRAYKRFWDTVYGEDIDD